MFHASIKLSDVKLAPILADCCILQGRIKTVLVWFLWKGALILILMMQASLISGVAENNGLGLCGFGNVSLCTLFCKNAREKP